MPLDCRYWQNLAETRTGPRRANSEYRETIKEGHSGICSIESSFSKTYVHIEELIRRLCNAKYEGRASKHKIT